jgi:hypothetical protein
MIKGALIGLTIYISFQVIPLIFGGYSILLSWVVAKVPSLVVGTLLQKPELYYVTDDACTEEERIKYPSSPECPKENPYGIAVDVAGFIVIGGVVGYIRDKKKLQKR